MEMSVVALANPIILKWARMNIGYRIEEAAKKIGISNPEKLRKTEAGIEHLTINQLRNAAKVYGRPFPIFFLESPPKDAVDPDFLILYTKESKIISPEAKKKNKFTSNYNKSAYFISIEITSANFYLQFYLLEYVIYHKNYNLTIFTYLEPLNSEIYNSSFTYIKYTPANGKAITSMEFVQFNMSVILSQQYDFLADIAEEMAEIYKKSEDLDLMELYYSYTNMGEGIRSLSELVKEQLGEYDYQILESNVVLKDYPIDV